MIFVSHANHYNDDDNDNDKVVILLFNGNKKPQITNKNNFLTCNEV